MLPVKHVAVHPPGTKEAVLHEMILQMPMDVDVVAVEAAAADTGARGQLVSNERVDDPDGLAQACFYGSSSACTCDRILIEVPPWPLTTGSPAHH